MRTRKSGATSRGLYAVALVAGLSLCGGALAQDSDGGEAPGNDIRPAYEDQLLRLSEILGALHFLRTLCDAGDGPIWRSDMDRLLNAESPGPVRRSRLVAHFNHGFETFHAIYTTCTPAANLSIRRYLAEAEQITGDIRLRYGQ